MALVNQAKREINAKIVYFGPGLAGKVTNLKYVYGKLKPEFRGALKTMQVQDARMLFFDFTPPGDGNVHGFRVRFHVYTISGEVIDPAAWKMVLKGVDGIVFVADAAPQRMAANRRSLDQLTAFLEGYGQSLSAIPAVYQYNKCDLPDALKLDELEGVLNPSRLPSFKASSQSGEGVLQTLLGLVKTMLSGLRDKGIEGIASGEGLQRMVEPPTHPAEQPAKVQSRPPLAELSAAAPLAGAQQPVAQPGGVSAAGLAAVEAQAVESRQPEEPLSLELTGAPQAAGPGLFRLPLTIRSGSRSRSLVLNLAISLEEEQ